MFRIPEFNLDQVSFWLGFVAASLFWLFYSKIKLVFPRLTQVLRHQVQVVKERQKSGVDLIIRQEVLRQAQRMHLANNLFSLDEILIPPKIIPVQHFPDSDKDPFQITIAEQVIPYLPDWPELTARYPINFLEPLEIIENPVRIALIGQPGSGKTTTLAYLASKIARKEAESSVVNALVPVHIHVLDFDFQHLLSTTSPEEDLISAFTIPISSLVKNKTRKFIRSAIDQNQLLLLLDGLDELSPEKLAEITSWVRRLISDHPQMRIIVSGSPDYLDGLITLEFIPMGLAGWSFDQRVAFSKKWGKLWVEHFGEAIEKNSNSITTSPELINNWLWDENKYWTPLEWTLMVWGAFVGSNLGITGKEGISAYFSQLDPKLIPIEALQTLAYDFCINFQESRSFAQIEQFFKKYDPKKFQDILVDSDNNSSKETSEKKKRKRKKVSSSAKAILHLLEIGVLKEHANEIISFANPLFAGYLASFASNPSNMDEIFDHRFWPLRISLLHYLASREIISSQVQDNLSDSGSPLYKDFFVFARFIKDLPLESNIRDALMRQCIKIFTQETLPLGTRARIMGAFITSNDPSVPALLKQFLKSSSPVVRQLSAIGCGALQNSKILGDLVLLLGDSDLIVQASTAIALGAYQDSTTKEILIEALLNGDEMVRQAVAETLTKLGKEGFDILRDRANSEDLLVRRAVISGLALVRASWAVEKLEKMTIEDGQWVVRNAAGQALEKIKAAHEYAPQILVPAGQAAWLIEFAAKQGLGLSANEPATDMLLLALKSGTYEEKIHALNYLQYIPEPHVINEINKVVMNGSGPLQEAALVSLWCIHLTGIKQ